MQDAKRPGTELAATTSAASARKPADGCPNAPPAARASGSDLRADDEERRGGDEALGDGGGDRAHEDRPGGGEQQSEDADHQGQRGGELDIAGREGVGEVCSEPSTRTVITPTGPVNSRRLLPNATAKAGAAQLA